MSNERTEMTVQEGNALPASLEEVTGWAKMFVASGMFADVNALAQAAVKIQAGRELGLPPIYSMMNINMITGRLAVSANLMASLVKRSRRYDYAITAHTDEVCSITFYERRGDKLVEAGVSTFTLADARRAELVRAGGNWVKYPKAMLFSRAISQGARLYAPDAIGGAYTSEELQASPAVETPESVPQAAALPAPAAAAPAALKPMPSGDGWAELVTHSDATRAASADTQPITDPQKGAIIATARKLQFSDADLAELIKRHGAATINDLSKAQAKELITEMQRPDGPPKGEK